MFLNQQQQTSMCALENNLHDWEIKQEANERVEKEKRERGDDD